MELKEYQKKAVKELVEKTIDILSLTGNRHKLVFKSPTGSGKTVMASKMMSQLSQELEVDSKCPYKQVAYLWLAPNKLHKQSYDTMVKYFDETHDIKPLLYDDIDHSPLGYIKANEILFVNWESIIRDDAIIVRETESSSSLYDIIHRTKEKDILIIAIIDEEHRFAGNFENQSEKALQKLDTNIEIRISATPSTESDYRVVVPREKVIKEQMIKKNIVLNPNLSFDSNEEINKQLTHLALKKREDLAKAYKDLKVKINPLLLIQLPNDNKEDLDSEDTSIRDEIVTYLKDKENISTENGRISIWLSKEKTNFEGVEKFDSMVDVLLFKEAIALGWDCPRAAILLIFRKSNNFTFMAQTVGRILRMPEQHYYEDEKLNLGYVYTNLSNNIIEVVKEDMDYMSIAYQAMRRKKINNVSFKSEYFERLAIERNRLGANFKAHLEDTIAKHWGLKSKKFSFLSDGNFDLTLKEERQKDAEIRHNKNREIVKQENRINLYVDHIGLGILRDLEITGEVGQSIAQKSSTYILKQEELNILYNTLCAKLIGISFEKVSITTLGCALKEVLDDLFGMNDNDVVKVVLYEENISKFDDVITLALETYRKTNAKHLRAKKEKLKEYNWEVPPMRTYNRNTHKIRENVLNHALMPFVELNNASDPEREFVKFLEKNSRYIDWWYKNGDSGMEHFSISYINSKGVLSLFYVDFIIRMKDGRVFLFDTKTKESDENAPAKHNALIDYMNRKENKSKNLAGGILIRKGENWKYSKEKINNTVDITTWESFYPDLINRI